MNSMLRSDHVLCRQAWGYVQPALYEAFWADSRGGHELWCSQYLRVLQGWQVLKAMLEGLQGSGLLGRKYEYHALKNCALCRQAWGVLYSRRCTRPLG